MNTMTALRVTDLAALFIGPAGTLVLVLLAGASKGDRSEAFPSADFDAWPAMS
jgi:hypothetical protein